MSLEEELSERVDRYVSMESEAISKIRISVPEGSHLMGVAMDFLRMIKNYFDDACHFKNKGDLINALSALNYSYGWIDAGVRFGLFDALKDTHLFTIYQPD